MSESATALDAISDAAQFESLATAVLRRARQDCASLIHTGINAEGKPVPSPIDGITVLSGSSPPRFIMLQHTTTARVALRSKWIGENGDIGKAAERIARERERTPNTRLTLILTTNRVPDEALVRDAHACAHAADIELDIWDQSRLADFLDHNPDGQWFRKIYLGIDQQRLSEDLLAELSERSARALRETVLDESTAWVDRVLDRALLAKVEENDGITFLVMPSGTGKTTAVAQLLSRWIDSRRFGLWIPPEAIERALTLDQAVGSVLHAYAPTLEENAGAVARSLGTADHPLLLVVDDINRSPRASALVERLATWCSPSRNSKDGEARGPVTVHLACPVWPQTVEQISEVARRLVTAHAVVHGAFTPAEAVTAVRRRASIGGHPVSEMRASEISGSLGNDPLLIALAPAATHTNRPAYTVIPSFIADQIQACATASPDGFVAADYHHALRALAGEMLMRRNLAPYWEDIAGWFPSDAATLTSLRNLVRRRTLCHIEGHPAQERMVFRHDRVRNAILAATLNRRMVKNQVSDNVLSDPFYAEILGLALMTDTLQSDWIDRLASMNPLALIHALQTFEEPSTEFEKAIVATIVSWLDEHGADRGTRHLRWAMQSILTNIDAPVVLQIAKHFTEGGRLLDQARFRNGDARSGAAFCYGVDPGVGAPFRDALVSHAKEKFGPKLLEDLQVALLDPELSPRLRTGALYLAGFVSDPALSDAITACWRNSGGTPEYLPAFVWAGCQCASECPEQMLDPIFDYWASLPDRNENDRDSPHRFVVDDDGIQFGFTRNPPAKAIRYLIGQAVRPELRWPITILLECVDHPDAVAFIAKERAFVAREIEGTDRFSPWLSIGGMRERRPLSATSRGRLQILWEEETSDRHLRNRSFELWALNATRKDLPLIQHIQAGNVLYDRSLQLRIKLGDQTAVSAFRDKIRTAQHRVYWWQFAREFWCEELTEQLEEELAQRGREFFPTWEKSAYETDMLTSELIMKLEPDTAESLLIRHWPHLHYDAHFVHAALFVATEKCCALVKETVDKSPDPKKLLEYMDHRWRIGGTEQRGRLNAARLAAIEPYLDLLGEMPIDSLWTACNVDGFFEWRRIHLDHRIPEKWRRRQGIDDADLFAGLDEIASRENHWWPGHWLERFEERGDAPERALTIVRKWLTDRKTLKAYDVAAECIALSGRRSDLGILTIPGVPTGPEAEAIGTDTHFAVCHRTLI